MTEETATETSGGLPHLASMNTVTPVDHLHSLMKLLRPPPTAAPTQASDLINLPGCLMFHCPAPLKSRSPQKSSSRHQEVQGFVNTQPYRPDALPHIQELPIPHTSIAPPVQHLLVHFIRAITVKSWSPTPSRQAGCYTGSQSAQQLSTHCPNILHEYISCTPPS